MGDSSTITTPEGLARSSPLVFITSTPTSPSATPTASLRRTGVPSRRPNTVIHSGMVAAKTEVTLDDSERSAAAMSPLPSTNRNRPATAAPSHWRRSGHGSLRQRATASSALPARRKRSAPSRYGGKPSSATAIARYVEPHSVHTAA